MNSSLFTLESMNLSLAADELCDDDQDDKDTKWIYDHYSIRFHHWLNALYSYVKEKLSVWWSLVLPLLLSNAVLRMPTVCRVHSILLVDMNYLRINIVLFKFITAKWTHISRCYLSIINTKRVFDCSTTILFHSSQRDPAKWWLLKLLCPPRLLWRMWNRSWCPRSKWTLYLL